MVELEDTDNAYDFSTLSYFTNEEMQSMIGFEPGPDQISGTTISLHRETGDSFADNPEPATGPLTGTLSGNVISQSSSFPKCNNGWETLIAAGKIKQASRAFKELPWHQSPLTTDLYPRLDNLEGEFPLVEDQYVPPLFDLQARQALLADLVTIAERRGWLGLSHSLYHNFPPPSILDIMVHRFFKQHNRKIDPWIHAPTFKPNMNNLELTATIVAASAITMPVISLCHVGSIMLKLLQITISEKVGCDSDPSNEHEIGVSFAILD